MVNIEAIIMALHWLDVKPHYFQVNTAMYAIVRCNTAIYSGGYFYHLTFRVNTFELAVLEYG